MSWGLHVKLTGNEPAQIKITVKPPVFALAVNLHVSTWSLIAFTASSCDVTKRLPSHLRNEWWELLNLYSYVNSYLYVRKLVNVSIRKGGERKTRGRRATHMPALRLLLRGRVSQKFLPSAHPCFEVVRFGLIWLCKRHRKPALVLIPSALRWVMNLV